MFWTRKSFVLLLITGLLMVACTTEAQRKQEDDAFVKRMENYITECANSQGLVDGQPITEEQRTELMWCGTIRWARDEVSKGSTDAKARLVVYLNNCDEMLGKDWGKPGSEKRKQLSSCIDMQAQKDIQLDSLNRALIFQQLQNLNQQKSITNCYIYGNWAQCQ